LLRREPSNAQTLEMEQANLYERIVILWVERMRA
jgi:hypothetical protein